MSSFLELIITAVGTETAAASVGKVNGALGDMVGALGRVAVGALSVEKAFEGVEGAIGAGGEFEHLSARTGQSVKDLVVLDQAFRNVGLSAEYIAQSSNMLQRALGGVSETGQRTDVAFKRLGTSIEVLKPLSYAQQLQVMAEGFAKLGSQSDRANVAMQLFGRAGGQMLQLLSDPAALKEAGEEAGRFADRLGGDASAFHEVEVRLGVLKTRMKEMWVVAAEQLLPALQSIASVLQSLNLSAVGAFLGTAGPGILGMGALTVMSRQLDSMVATATLKLGAGVAQNLGYVIAKFTGALATAMPYGLGAAIAVEIVAGLWAAWNEWRGGIVSKANAGFDEIKKSDEQINAVRTEDDRTKAIAPLRELEKKTKDALWDEQTKFYQDDASDRAIASYQEQLRLIRAKIELLNSARIGEIADQNRAADAAAKEAARNKEAQAWLKSSAAEKYQQAITEQAQASRTDEARLFFAKSRLKELDDSKAYIEEEIRQLGTSAQREADWLKVTGERAAKLKEIAETEQRIARTKSDQAKNALENALSEITARSSKLAGDYTQTEAEKWPQQKQLLEDEIAVRQKYLDQQKAIRATADTDAAKAQGDTNVRGAQKDLDSSRQKLSSRGADPNSIGAQLQSQSTAMRDGIGTIAEQIGRVWKNMGETMRSSLGTAFYDMLSRAKNFKDAAGALYVSMAQALGQSTAQMAADWVMQHVIMDNVRKLFHALGLIEEKAATGAQVGVHATGEAAKTGATGAGAVARGAMRLAETIYHGLLVGIRTAMHVAGEIAQTAATVAQSALRIIAMIAESLVSIIKAAVGAMSAMASIPYVGPFLAVAAAAAIIAEGSSLIKGARESGGPVEAGQAYLVGERRPEVFVPHTDGFILPDARNFNFSAPTAPAARSASQGKTALSAPQSPYQMLASAAGGGTGSGRSTPPNVHIYLDKSAYLAAIAGDMSGIAHQVYDKRARS